MKGRPASLAPRRRRSLDETIGILALATALIILAGSWFDRHGLVPLAVGQLLEGLGVGTYYLVILLGLVGSSAFLGRRPPATLSRMVGMLVIAPLFAATIEGLYLLDRGFPKVRIETLVPDPANGGPGGSIGLYAYGHLAALLGAWSTLFLLAGITLALSTFLADLGLGQVLSGTCRLVAAILTAVHRTIKAPILIVLRIVIAAILGLHHIIFVLLKDIVTLTARLVEAVGGPRDLAGAPAQDIALPPAPIPIVGRTPAPTRPDGAPATRNSPNSQRIARESGEDADDEAASVLAVAGGAIQLAEQRPQTREGASSVLAFAGGARSGAGTSEAVGAGGSGGSGEPSSAAARPSGSAPTGIAAASPTSRAERGAAGAGSAVATGAVGNARNDGTAHVTEPLARVGDDEDPEDDAEKAEGKDALSSLLGRAPAGTAAAGAGTGAGAGGGAGGGAGAGVSAAVALKRTPGSTSSALNGPVPRKTPLHPPSIAPVRLPADAPRPPETLFNVPPGVSPDEETEVELRTKAARIVETLAHFKIQSEITQITRGPSVTQFELRPQAGIKLSSISSLSSNLAMSLETKSVRIEAPILGKSVVGIEVPNRTMAVVSFRKIIASPRFKASRSLLTFAIGEDITGQPVIGDMAKLPHLLVAGATGSGKSVCINTILASLLTNAGPDIVNVILIDPKMVELSVYSGIPHLVTDVVTDPADAAAALKWAVIEMERRYRYLSRFGIRNIRTFNEAKLAGALRPPDGETPIPDGPMPYIVVIIDELADLMVVAKKDVEESIMRLTQMARAVGIHLVVATQRPSVNVITGVIKANLPSRIAFAVASKVDSKVILDAVGAEKLLGRGDMLYLPTGEQRPQRIQGAYIDDEEVKRLVGFLKEHGEPNYQDIIAEVKEAKGGPKSDHAFDDKMFNDCLRFAMEKGEASTSLFQTYLDIGYNRAARIVEEMEARGIISGRETGKRRKVLIAQGDLERFLI